MNFLNTKFLSSSLAFCKILQKSDCDFQGVEIDSRKSLQDKIFFAIKGNRFDGHDFLSSALDKGAKAFIVSDLEKSRFLLESKSISVLLVPDTVKALAELAHKWRKKLKLTVIGITGSCGKTSVCSFTKTLLSDLSPYASPKSYNNTIGVSLSLLAVKKEKALLIQEIGTNKPGEIAFLTKLSEPDISAVTMVGASHLEGLKDLTGVAEEKKQIYLKSPSAVWVFNKDNPWTKAIAKECYKLRSFTKESLTFKQKPPAPFIKKNKSLFSFSSKELDADLSFQIIKQEKSFTQLKGRISGFEFKTRLPFLGKESVENLMCASTIALAMGIPPKRIAEKLMECRKAKGRQESFLLKEKGIKVCFDAYNANPSSMAFFTNYCEQLSEGKNRILILGDMKELGEQTEYYHKELALNRAVLSSRVVFFVGEQAFLIGEEMKKNNYQGFYKAFKTYTKELSLLVKEHWKKEDFIGIKASRSLALEQVFFDLTGKKIL